MKKSLLFLALVCSMQMMGASLVVEKTDGTQHVKDIAVIGKWVFVGTDLQLLDKQGNILATEAIANVRKIVFSNEPTAVENVEQENIVVFPNPTHDVLYIKGIEAQTLRVFDLQGRVVVMNEGTEVDVKHLPVGTYLLQIGTQVVRVIKN